MGASVVASFSGGGGSGVSAASGGRLGEVIETTSLTYVAESDHLHALPEFGALVRVGSTQRAMDLYGVVCFGATGGMDAGRRAVRRGSDDVVDAAVYHRHPELELVLRTLFTVSVLGYVTDGQVRHSVPPLPAPLHYSVFPCAAQEVVRFARQPHYLSSLLEHVGDVAADHVVASHLLWVWRVLGDDAWLTSAVSQLARLLQRDYERLRTVVTMLEAHLSPEQTSSGR